jgi:putative salt-induced outer membrane protein YdiY
MTLVDSRSADAQVNTEPLRKKLKEKGWSFTIQASLDARTGNTEGLDASAAGGVGFAYGRHMGLLFGNGEFTRWNDTTSVDNAFVHARYNYEFLHWLWGEAFIQIQTDHFQRILLRDLAGLGPRFALYQSKEFDVYFGTGWMVEHDAINVLPDSNDLADFYAHRWNNYLSVNYEVDTRISLASTIYAQPRWNDFNDYRVLEETAVVFKITKVLAASIIGDYHYDSRPPAGVLTTDLEIKNVLSVTY